MENRKMEKLENRVPIIKILGGAINGTSDYSIINPISHVPIPNETIEAIKMLQQMGPEIYLAHMESELARKRMSDYGEEDSND